MPSNEKLKPQAPIEDRDSDWWLAAFIAPAIVLLGIIGLISQAYNHPTSEIHAARAHHVQQIQKANTQFLTAECAQNEDRAASIAKKVTEQMGRHFNPNTPARNIPIEFNGLQTTATIHHDAEGRITKIEETGTHYLICKV